MRNKHTRFVTQVRRSGVGKAGNPTLDIIILADLIPAKMKSYGPTPLFKLPSGDYLIDIQLTALEKSYPNSNIILTVGYMAESVADKKKDLRLVENQLFETTNHIESLRLALNNSTCQHVMIIHGDVLFDADSIDNITRSGSSILIDEKECLPKNSIGVTVVDNRATVFSYAIKEKWTGIVFLKGKELKLFKQFCKDKIYNKRCSHEALNWVLEHEGSLDVYSNPARNFTKIESGKQLRSL